VPVVAVSSGAKVLAHEASIIATKERAEMKMIEFFIPRKIVVDGAVIQSQSAVNRKRHGLIIKGKRISSRPQYGHRDLQGVPRRLGERHGFEHGFPLIRSL